MPRLNLEITAKVRDRWHATRDAIEASSLTATIRIAVHLLHFVFEHRRAGGEVILRSKDGDEKTIEFLF